MVSRGILVEPKIGSALRDKTRKEKLGLKRAKVSPPSTKMAL